MWIIMKTIISLWLWFIVSLFHPFKPELTIVIYLIHYKPRIAVAILDL